MRKLVVDGQLFQTPAWNRGMGKYSLELLVALSKSNKQNPVWDVLELILSSHIEADPVILNELESRLSDFKISFLDFAESELDNLTPTTKNRALINEHLGGFSPDAQIDFLILSLMQSGISPAFPDLPNVHKIVLFYDLIPLMFHTIYLTRSINRQEYTSRLAELLRADTFLAISKTVANDLVWHTGLSKKRVFSIDGGPIQHGTTTKAIKVKRPFILMPTGDDLRKNNKRAIEAFAKFNKSHKYKYHLVVTSIFTEPEMIELQKISKEVVFTGNVSGEELNYLYRESLGLLFPTEYEGLGLPVLEAMEWNKPILCSDISVFREISEKLMYTFNPKSIDSITSALNALISGDVVVDKGGYKKVLSRYTWQNTSAKAIDAMTRKFAPDNSRKLDSVCFTPNPSTSLLGRHAQMLHAEIAKQVDISYRFQSDLASRSYDHRINYLGYISPGSYSIDGKIQIELSEKSIPIFYLNNSPDCAKSLFTALAHPGVAVLYTNSLDRVWESLVDEGLITESRRIIEADFSKSYCNDNSLLVSLIQTQKAIVVFDRKLLTKIQKINRKLGRKDLILKYSPIPVSATVYADVLPKKRPYNSLEIHPLSSKNARYTYDTGQGFVDHSNNTHLSDHEFIELVQRYTTVVTDGLSDVDNSIITTQTECLLSEDKQLNMASREYRDFAILLKRVVEEVDES